MHTIWNRDPGVFGAAWTNEQLNTEIIVDGIHSHPASVHMFYAKGNEHMYLITMRCVQKEGNCEYDLGGQNVIVKEKARLASGA